jgi:hypothetical protein
VTRLVSIRSYTEYGWGAARHSASAISGTVLQMREAQHLTGAASQTLKSARVAGAIVAVGKGQQVMPATSSCAAQPATRSAVGGCYSYMCMLQEARCCIFIDNTPTWAARL